MCTPAPEDVHGPHAHTNFVPLEREREAAIRLPHDDAGGGTGLARRRAAVRVGLARDDQRRVRVLLQPFRKFPTSKWGEELWLMARQGADRITKAMAI